MEVIHFGYFLAMVAGGLMVYLVDIKMADYFEKKQGWCRNCGPDCKRVKK